MTIFADRTGWLDNDLEVHDFFVRAFTETLDCLTSAEQRALFFGVHVEDDETGEAYPTMESEGGEFLTFALREALMGFVRRCESDEYRSQSRYGL